MGFWLNQALGLLGSLIVFASVQFNNRRVILAAQAAAWREPVLRLAAPATCSRLIQTLRDHQHPVVRAQRRVLLQRPQVGAEPRVAVGVSGAVRRQHRPHVGGADEPAARHRHEHDDGRALDARHAPHAPALPDEFAVLVHV